MLLSYPTRVQPDTNHVELHTSEEKPLHPWPQQARPLTPRRRIVAHQEDRAVRVHIHTGTIHVGRGATLLVENAERRKIDGILFIFSLLYEYTPHEYVRVPVIYRVYQVEYGIHILVAASQEYVNTYLTRRLPTPWIPPPLPVPHSLGAIVRLPSYPPHQKN